MSHSGTAILVVDGDAAESREIVGALAGAGYAVTWQTNSIDGLVAVEDDGPALVVLRWNLPYIDGDTFVRALRSALPASPPVVALIEPDQDVGRLRDAGADAWVASPTDSALLVSVVGDLLCELRRATS
jgi:DNA-binding response OmpR family regulator